MRKPGVILAGLLVATPLAATAARAETAGPPPYRGDRGGDIPTSLFGTYVSDGETLLYAFYEYTSNHDAEYNPVELGFTGTDDDFIGKETEHEALIFLGYGFTDRLAFEFEAALWSRQTLDKAPDDPSTMPDSIEESGLGDVQSQLRWIWAQETA